MGEDSSALDYGHTAFYLLKILKRLAGKYSNVSCPTFKIDELPILTLDIKKRGGVTGLVGMSTDDRQEEGTITMEDTGSES